MGRRKKRIRVCERKVERKMEGRKDRERNVILEYLTHQLVYRWVHSNQWIMHLQYLGTIMQVNRHLVVATILQVTQRAFLQH